MKYKVLPWGLAVAGWTVAAVLAVTVYFGLLWPIDQNGLQPFPAGDSIELGESFTIVCKAWSNRPDAEFKPPYDKRWVGFRMVSDCVTEEKRVVVG